jgi:hypothetical protein
MIIIRLFQETTTRPIVSSFHRFIACARLSQASWLRLSAERRPGLTLTALTRAKRNPNLRKDDGMIGDHLQTTTRIIYLALLHIY